MRMSGAPPRAQPGQELPGFFLVEPKGDLPGAQEGSAASNPVVPMCVREERPDPKDLQEAPGDNTELVEDFSMFLNEMVFHLTSQQL